MKQVKTLIDHRTRTITFDIDSKEIKAVYLKYLLEYINIPEYYLLDFEDNIYAGLKDFKDNVAVPHRHIEIIREYYLTTPLKTIEKEYATV